jgi:hypothetical protein
MGKKTIIRFILTAFSAVTLSACAHKPSGSSTNQESYSMSTSSPGPSQVQGDTAESLLLRLIELIKQSRSAPDFTPERLAAIMQRQADIFAPNHFGFSGKLTSEWSYALDVEDASRQPARLDLEFIDTTPGRSAAATDICQVDFDLFSSELKKDGFSQTTIYGEHGEVVYDLFERPDLSIRVSTIGEAPLPPEKARHNCVRLVTVQ